MLSAVLVFWSIGFSCAQDVVTLKFLFLFEEGQEHYVEWLNQSTSLVSVENILLEPRALLVSHEESDESLICEGFTNGATMVIDATWTGNDDAKRIATNFNIPYARIDLSISPLLNLLDKYLSLRNNTDVVVIFENSQLIDEALYYWIDSTRLRMIVSDKLDKTSTERLKKLRPIPNSYAIVATTHNMKHMINLAIKERLVAIPERWNLVFLDFLYKKFPKNYTIEALNFLKIDSNFCCQLLEQPDECNCPERFDFKPKFLEIFLREFVRVFRGLDNNEEINKRISCQNSAANDSSRFETNQKFLAALRNSSQWFSEVKDSYRLNVNAMVEIVIESDLRVAARLDENGKLNVVKGINVLPVKPFYRIGITHAIPWTFREKNPETGEFHWAGYCIDFIKKLSTELNFDYELVVPARGTFGEKDQNGEWDGLVGDIARGETEIAIGAVVMRADREEVVDYVPPYYDQSGISIVMRKPIRKTSLFRFMTVLKLEVWLSIMAALVITAFMMWFLDKYSPYSAQNNKEAYPYECRLFSLRECFWFALTSFTPQGGGEAPKSLSARALVTAYWLFVVLMLATFTANLAAFLTVERMQTPVQSLDQLARQSRINYTVVEGSDTHQYFINMKYAEDTLYRMWKELTLNASTDDVRYRVWDYPIREQYGHILIAINESIPVNDSSEGFQMVNDRIDGDFAFIHDSSEVKYEISRNCNFTEIGEVFAEKPYAVMVQQGSHLSDIIGMKILDLQKDRYFEALRAKYWNYSIRGVCQNEEEEEGITLESLGGVFIATLFGLVMAMITLGFEVLYYKRKSKAKKDGKKEKQVVNKAKPIKVFPSTITIGSTFEPMIRPNLTPRLNPRKNTH